MRAVLSLLGKGSNDGRVASCLGTNSTSESILVDTVTNSLIGCRWELGTGENRAIDGWTLGRHLGLRRLSRGVGTSGAVVLCRKTVKVARGLNADKVSSALAGPGHWGSYQETYVFPSLLKVTIP